MVIKRIASSMLSIIYRPFTKSFVNCFYRTDVMKELRDDNQVDFYFQNIHLENNETMLTVPPLPLHLKSTWLWRSLHYVFNNSAIFSLWANCFSKKQVFSVKLTLSKLKYFDPNSSYMYLNWFFISWQYLRIFFIIISSESFFYVSHLPWKFTTMRLMLMNSREATWLL